MFPSSNREATELEAVAAAAGTHTWAWNTTSAVNRPSCPWTRSHYSGLLLSSLLFLLENFPLIDRKGPCQHSFQCRVFSLQRPRLLSTFARCLKIPEKVSFYNIASEASYVYILSIKVIKIPKMVNLTSFWKTEAYSQLVLPDRSTSKEQKLVENLMTFFEPFFPTVHYYPIPFVS